MQVPNAQEAIVSQEKIVRYLLNPLHPDGAGKAWFFLRLGFRVEQWEVLADALRELVVRAEITSRLDSKHGAKYIVDGLIDTPSERTATVRTVWIIDADEQAPRLVTAYPHQQEP